MIRGLEIDSPSRGRKLCERYMVTIISYMNRLEIDSPSRGRKLNLTSSATSNRDDACLEIDSPSRGRKRYTLPGKYCQPPDPV